MSGHNARDGALSVKWLEHQLCRVTRIARVFLATTPAIPDIESSLILMLIRNDGRENYNPHLRGRKSAFVDSLNLSKSCYYLPLLYFNCLMTFRILLAASESLMNNSRSVKVIPLTSWRSRRRSEWSKLYHDRADRIVRNRINLFRHCSEKGPAQLPFSRDPSF